MKYPVCKIKSTLGIQTTLYLFQYYCELMFSLMVNPQTRDSTVLAAGFFTTGLTNTVSKMCNSNYRQYLYYIISWSRAVI